MTNHAITLMAKAMAKEDGSINWRDYLPMARAAFIVLREHDLATTLETPSHKLGDAA